MPPKNRADAKPADDDAKPAEAQPEGETPQADDIEALRAQIEALTAQNADLVEQVRARNELLADIAAQDGDERAGGAEPAAPQDKANPTDGMCPEHFPLGWDSDIIEWIERKTDVKQHEVSCEHGTYRR